MGHNHIVVNGLYNVHGRFLAGSEFPQVNMAIHLLQHHIDMYVYDQAWFYSADDLNPHRAQHWLTSHWIRYESNVTSSVPRESYMVDNDVDLVFRQNCQCKYIDRRKRRTLKMKSGSIEKKKILKNIPLKRIWKSQHMRIAATLWMALLRKFAHSAENRGKNQ